MCLYCENSNSTADEAERLPLSTVAPPRKGMVVMMKKKIKIMLDAGHYGLYNRSPVVPEYYESVQMWKLKDYLKEELLKYQDFVVGETREKQEADLEVTRRGRKAEGYDLLLSLHSNAVTANIKSTDGQKDIARKQAAVEALTVR